MEEVLKEIYLDNSATTVVTKSVADAVYEAMTVNYGNPSSLHSKGFEAEKEIEGTRKIIANKLNCDYRDIYFTSGGTEANNLAIIGIAESKKRSGKKIVTTAIEHASVLESMQYLETLGFEVVYLTPESDNEISKEKIINAIDSNTILTSIMLVNNETGGIQPVESAAKAIKFKKLNSVLHSDCVQAFGKMPINVKKMGIDIVTISGHKIHAPKGIGAIYISPSVRISKRTFGGEQERKIRPGTQSVPLISGFGRAITEMTDNTEYYISLKEYLLSKLKNIENVVINSSENSISSIVNFSVKGIKSETLLHYLSSNGIYVSSGSACTKGKQSHVLKAYNLADDRINSAIRVSFSKFNTFEDIDSLIYYINEANAKLQKIIYK